MLPAAIGIAMKFPIAALALAATLAGSVQPARQTFVGTLSDEMCGRSHAAMAMGPTDAACALACRDEHGSAFVLVTDDQIYSLSGLDVPASLAGATVKVVGTLDSRTNTIRVDSIGAP
jgi:hypothetical protein